MNIYEPWSLHFSAAAYALKASMCAKVVEVKEGNYIIEIRNERFGACSPTPNLPSFRLKVPFRLLLFFVSNFYQLIIVGYNYR